MYTCAGMHRWVKYTCMHTYMLTYICLYMYTCAGVHRWVKYTCMHIYMLTYICLYMYTCAGMHRWVKQNQREKERKSRGDIRFDLRKRSSKLGWPGVGEEGFTAGTDTHNMLRPNKHKPEVQVSQASRPCRHDLAFPEKDETN